MLMSLNPEVSTDEAWYPDKQISTEQNWKLSDLHLLETI